MNRVVQLGPVVFALTGAGAGICASMLFHNKRSFQIDFEDSLPFALIGVVAGAVIGCFVSAKYAHSPRLARRAGGLLGLALGAVQLRWDRRRATA